MRFRDEDYEEDDYYSEGNGDTIPFNSLTFTLADAKREELDAKRDEADEIKKTEQKIVEETTQDVTMTDVNNNNTVSKDVKLVIKPTTLSDDFVNHVYSRLPPITTEPTDELEFSMREKVNNLFFYFFSIYLLILNKRLYQHQLHLMSQ